MSVNSMFLKKAFMQSCKCYCTKSLILKKIPRKKNIDKLPINMLVKKKTAKKKVKSVYKHPADYSEEIWLENLDRQKLKLYRRTSFGSFRKINIDNLMVKLKEIYPCKQLNEIDKLESSLEKKESIADNKENLASSDSSESKLASPQMSEYLIKNMLEFPMLYTQKDDPLLQMFENEKNEYGTIDSINFPSITQVLQETMSVEAKKRLEKWKQQMKEEMGEEAFHEYTIGLMKKGSKFHLSMKTYLTTNQFDEMETDPEIRGCWKSLEKLLPDISDVKMVEESVHHPVLMYKGNIDCVASYQKTPCVIEWKKSNKIKNTLCATYDAPLQLCAYLAALSWQNSSTAPSQGLVVIAYPHGSPANVFLMDADCCQFYWGQWLRRLQTYWLNKSSILVRKEADV